MRLKTLLGAIAVCVSFAFASQAHADWRESILGNSIYSGGSLTGGPAAAPAKKAQKPAATKTASLGATDYTPAKSSAGKSSASKKPASQPQKKKSVASSNSGSGPYKYPSKNQNVPTGQTLSGQASYYWQPQQLASGGTFNPSAMTAAHKTLPFGTKVRVTNQRNGQSVVVTINDRGPYIAGRIIDLSSGAAGVIGMKQAGVVPVKVAVLGK